MTDNELSKKVETQAEQMIAAIDERIRQWLVIQNKKKRKSPEWHIAQLYIDSLEQRKNAMEGIVLEDRTQQKLIETVWQQFDKVFDLLREIADEMKDKASRNDVINAAQQAVNGELKELLGKMQQETTKKEAISKLPDPRQFA